MESNKERYAVAYMRYSSDNQNENSIQYQRNTILAYCYQKNITLLHEYVDEAFTATNDRRPAFQKMIKEAINKPQWDTVLIYDLSRFARNNSDAVYYTNQLNDVGIDIVSITQEFGRDNEGRLMAGIMNLLNEYYSRNNGKTAHAGMKVKAMEGKHCGGKPPLGYDLDINKKLVLNPDEAEAVKIIFKMVEQDYSYNQIADYLNRNGYRTKSGNEFKKNSIIGILQQEKYTGTYVWNRVKHKNSKGQGNSHAEKPMEEQVHVEDGCPIIIPKEQFEWVQDLISSRARGRASSKSRHHYMLSGLKVLKCAECGSYMIGAIRSSHDEKYAVYYCPKHKNKECSVREIPTENLDKMVAKKLANDFVKRTDLSEIFKRVELSKVAQSLRNRLLGKEKEISNLVKVAAKCSDSMVIDKLKALSEEKKAIETEIVRQEKNVTTIMNSDPFSIGKKLAKMLCKSDDPDVKEYLKKNIESIVVDNETVEIILVEN